jgi:hypothetical protein
MAEKLSQGMIMKALDYGYDKAVNGLPGLETAQELAINYLTGDESRSGETGQWYKW